MELLISAANAEVTDGFCTLGKREAGEREEGGVPKSPRTTPREGLGLPAGAPQSICPPRGLCVRRLALSVCRAGGRPGWHYGASPSVTVCPSASVPGPVWSGPPLPPPPLLLLRWLGNSLFHWALLCARWLSMLSDRALCPVKRAHSRKRGSSQEFPGA